MLHKLFQWWYDKTRSSYGQSYRKIDVRSKERDLIHYFHDFGGDGMNTRTSLLRRKSIRVVLTVFGPLFCWFAYESYHGLFNLRRLGRHLA